MLRIAVPFAGTLILLGIAPKSMGLVIIEEPDLLDSSLPLDSPLCSWGGPHMTADCFANVKSISSS